MGRDFLPRQDVPIAGRELATNPYYVWFQGLERLIAQGGSSIEGLQAQIDALKQEIADLPGSETLLHAMGSIQIDGAAPDYFLSLQGDENSPGPTYYYGTDSAGAKGFFAIASAFEAGDGVTLTTDAATGVTTIEATAGTGGVLPVVTGEVPPVLLYADDGSLIYAPASY